MVVGRQRRRGKTGENGRGNKRMAVVAQGETGMEALPVELIGSGLSHLADAGCDEGFGYLPEVENGRTEKSPQTALQEKGLESRSKNVDRRSGSWYHENSDAHVKCPIYVHRLSW